MKTVILSGGLGTRLSEETQLRPKPMVEIGGLPILWHIMKIYSAYGHNEFVVALGYKAESIKSSFLNFYHIRRDLSVPLADGRLDIHDGDHEDWLIHLIDTGIPTQTGGRLQRLRHLLKDETFMMTYGDGVADVDISKGLDFHRRHGRVAPMTGGRPPRRVRGPRARRPGWGCSSPTAISSPGWRKRPRPARVGSTAASSSWSGASWITSTGRTQNSSTSRSSDWRARDNSSPTATTASGSAW